MQILREIDVRVEEAHHLRVRAQAHQHAGVPDNCVGLIDGHLELAPSALGGALIQVRVLPGRALPGEV